MDQQTRPIGEPPSGVSSPIDKHASTANNRRHGF
jgi:hypothetical protein